MGEKFCLKWNDFGSNASRAFGIFKGEHFLQDVTLVGDDNCQVAAHKLVLSACSEYFKNIFKMNKHPNPFLCLEGVSSKDVRNVMDYMYNGEVQIFFQVKRGLTERMRRSAIPHMQRLLNEQEIKKIDVCRQIAKFKPVNNGL